MEKEVATILEVINKYKGSSCRQISTEAKKTQLPYYTSSYQAEMHEDAAIIVAPSKLWSKEAPNTCRVLNIYDFVIHCATTVVTIVNKYSQLYREDNKIKGGRNYYIRSANIHTNKPYALFRVGEGFEDVVLPLYSGDRNEYIRSAALLSSWFAEQSKESPVYIHYGGFDVPRNEIDAFISHANSFINNQ